ncbi:envelope stress sensor histidine kinase CpxA [Veronia pacifica]|uniref:histidine kinase n=1 Tax=Veronia pacifica TaxID=1080227 RepID=A0A1C3EGQ7_9GAMM|nr:envelope stress sensor histidine kinase CpxA [Veronia pacifica]ODA32394.1 two-component system sensor histidine kinase CpxA [Veronia pacifica]
MRFPLFRSLYGSIFTIFWFTLFLVLVAVIFAQHNDPRIAQQASRSITNEGTKLASLAAYRLDAPGAELTRDRLMLFTRFQGKDRRHLFFVTPEGDVISGKLPRGPIRRAIRNFLTLSDNPDSPLQRKYGSWILAGPYVVPSQNKDDPVWLYIGRGGIAPEHFIVNILDSPFQFLLVAMAISTPLLISLAWALSRPARRFQKAAKRVADGHFDGAPELEKGTQEFREAGASFNHMVKAINGMMSSQQRLLSDISHELRSPLTRLRMANAVAIRKQGESAELKRIDMEAERLESMISDLLSLSRMQIDSHVSHSIFSPQELWGEMLDDAKFEAGQSGKKAEVSVMPDSEVEAFGPLLCSALENVVRNAIRYAEHRIDIRFRTANGELVIEVSDDGAGVPEEEINEIFRPFYRVSSSRNRKTGGTGLGLAITDNAIRQHNGRCYAQNKHNGGLTVTLIIPLHKP